jgi:hypothetical protein
MMAAQRVALGYLIGKTHRAGVKFVGTDRGDLPSKIRRKIMKKTRIEIKSKIKNRDQDAERPALALDLDPHPLPDRNLPPHPSLDSSTLVGLRRNLTRSLPNNLIARRLSIEVATYADHLR